MKSKAYEIGLRGLTGLERVESLRDLTFWVTHRQAFVVLREDVVLQVVAALREDVVLQALASPFSVCLPQAWPLLRQDYSLQSCLLSFLPLGHWLAPHQLAQ